MNTHDPVDVFAGPSDARVIRAKSQSGLPDAPDRFDILMASIRAALGTAPKKLTTAKKKKART